MHTVASEAEARAWPEDAEMEKMDTRRVVTAVTVFTALLYALCAAAYFLAQQLSLRIADLWVHGLDLAAIAKQPSVADALLGFVTILPFAAFLAWLFAAVWNRCGGD